MVGQSVRQARKKFKERGHSADPIENGQGRAEAHEEKLAAVPV
jgi:hypothetical protein